MKQLIEKDSREVLTKVTAATSGPMQLPVVAAFATSTTRWMPWEVASAGSLGFAVLGSTLTPATAMSGCRLDTPAATMTVSTPWNSGLRGDKGSGHRWEDRDVRVSISALARTMPSTWAKSAATPKMFWLWL